VIASFPVMPFDTEAALHWGTAMGEGQRIGAIPPNDDAKIAAIAAVRGLTVLPPERRQHATFRST